MSTRILTGLMIAALAACNGSPFGAEPELSGVYDLVEADGDGLPVEVWSGESHEMTLISEELEFRPGGLVVRTSQTVTTELATSDGEVTEEVQEVEYRINGPGISMGRFDPCPPNAFCLPNDIGVVRGDRVEVQSYRWTGGILVYQRR